MEIKFAETINDHDNNIIIPISEELELLENVQAQSQKYNNIIGNILANDSSFKGKKGDQLIITHAEKNIIKTFFLIGIGKKTDLTHLDFMNFGGEITAILNAKKIQNATLILDQNFISSQENSMAVGEGIYLRHYQFIKYKTQKVDEQLLSLKSITLIVKNAQDVEENFSSCRHVAVGVHFTRDLVSEPPNVLYPESYADRCQELTKLGVKVEVLGYKEMEKLGFGALLGVAQGSIREPKLVIIEWKGANDNDPPIAFIGKGVTFDSGGISIKPSAGMEDMKYDMAGSATVVGLIRTLAARKAKVNVVGIIGLVENMPDGNAQRPSDVVKTMSGQTVEVLNTDAEGRLVLADALWYCQDRFKPKFMINLATLTGAIVVTLGEIYAGLFSNNDDLSKKLLDIAEKVGEKLWRLPLDPAYDKQIESAIADMQNISNGRGAGSITAAQFLQRFVNDVPWAHLDIAGVAWTKKDLPLTPKGATAFGVRLLNKFVKAYYE
ncbi:Cytosol aminopeptidase [Rickettsiales bacterium Ac37b]|nr:Cytosol aminopeptidase [Rickettsiales bacterium Ac37b]